MKLSEFILDVVKTVRQLPSDKYVPHSITWHMPIPEKGICEACLGGMYAAAKGWIPFDKRLWKYLPGETDHMTVEQTNQVLAANDLRMAYWLTAQERLGIPREEQIDLAMQTDAFPGPPDPVNYYDWKYFDKHLSSLEDRAHQLQTLGQ